MDGSGGTGEPRVHVRAYDSATYILRQSLRQHFEAPFIYLFIGTERALLVDTGTGNVGLRAAVDAVLAGRNLELLVTHTHSHDDHIGGDEELSTRPRTRLLSKASEAVFAAGLPGVASTSIDLGERTLDVLAIPGHHPSHVAFYDRKTRILLTGDTLYPGRIYVRNYAAFRASIAGILAFIEAGHPVSHILGSHIELSADGVEYEDEAPVHPCEHQLSLGVEQLYDLRAMLTSVSESPVRTARPHYVVVPVT